MPTLLAWEHDEDGAQRVHSGDTIEDQEGFDIGIINPIDGGFGICEFIVDGEKVIKRCTLGHLRARE